MIRLTAVSTLILSCLCPATSQAGMFDWLFGPRIEPQVAYYPPAVVATQTNRVVVQYSPRVRYRTRWARVPVTVYRPTSSMDPNSGCTVSCMRPCTTYQWQARRVPITTFRPIYTVQRGAYQVVQQPVASSCCGAGVVSAPATTTQPYYDYPAAGSSGGAAESAVPADTRPSLPRGASPPAAGQGASILRRVPANRPLSRTTPVQPSRATHVGESPRRNPTRPVFASPQKAPTASPSRVTPIPDRSRERHVAPPALLRAKDRTVYLPVRQAWASAPIEWSRPTVKPISRVKQPKKSVARTQRWSGQDWDDQGWNSTNR